MDMNNKNKNYINDINTQKLIRDMSSNISLYKKENEFTVDAFLEMNKNHQKINKSSSNSSLVISLSKRLRQLEPLCSRQKETIDELCFELDATKQQLTQNQKDMAQELMNTKKELDLYKKQVREMEKFLSDYGLLWNGFKANKVSDENNDKIIEISEELIPFDDVIKALEELNRLAGDGEMMIVTNNKKASFEPPPSISLILFQDGLFLKKGPFRSYKNETTKRFIADVIDGYFPTELQKQYPEGVVFMIQDRRHNKFDPNTIDQYIKAALSKQLPKTTVCDGKLIDLVTPIHFQNNNLLHHHHNSNNNNSNNNNNNNNNNNTIIVPTLTVKQLSSDDRTILTNITTLQVKLSKQTLILKMKFMETVGDVRKHVEQYAKTSLFTLQTTFPKHIYDNNDLTLKEAGLTPNATLFVNFKS